MVEAVGQQAAEFWPDERDTAVGLDATGRIVDYLNPGVTRPDTPEERVRQTYVRQLHEDYGYPRSCLAVKIPISIGTQTKEADIIVYKDETSAANRHQGGIHLVVETKAPTRQDGHNQLVSYIFPTSAEGGVWTNGDQVAYFRRQNRPEQRLLDWNGIPTYGETWDAIGLYRKSQLRKPHNLKSVFRKCHNAIYKMGIDSEDVALDILRIVLAKYRDEQNPGDFCEFRCTPGEYQTPDGRAEVAGRVRSLFRQVAAANPDVFPANEEITAGDYEVATVVSELQSYRFLATDDDDEDVYDVIGSAYETYVSAHLKGPRGQYFTNRLVVNLMVKIANPSEHDVVLDPAVGSAGFLISAMRFIQRRIQASARSQSAKRQQREELKHRLFGVDKSPKLVKVAKANMILGR